MAELNNENSLDAILVGRFWNSVDNQDNAFFARISRKGDIVWAKQFGGQRNIYFSTSIAITADNKIFVSGASDAGNMFVINLTTQGQLLWGKRIENGSIESILINQDGHVVVSGIRHTFNQTNPNMPPYYSFIMGLSGSKGDFLWGQKLAIDSSPQSKYEPFYAMRSISSLLKTENVSVKGQERFFMIGGRSLNCYEKYFTLALFTKNGQFIWAKQTSIASLKNKNHIECSELESIDITNESIQEAKMLDIDSQEIFPADCYLENIGLFKRDLTKSCNPPQRDSATRTKLSSSINEGESCELILDMIQAAQ